MFPVVIILSWMDDLNISLSCAAVFPFLERALHLCKQSSKLCRNYNLQQTSPLQAPLRDRPTDRNIST